MFFRFAAKLGNAQAMSALGFAYRFGIGVEKNCSNSKVYYYKAAKRSKLDFCALYLTFVF